MIGLQRFTFNPFEENTYVLFDETKEAILIDPGCYEPHEQEELFSYVQSNNLKVVSIINTHGHIDHVLGNFACRKKYGVPIAIHPLDKPVLKSVSAYAGNYGFGAYQSTEADIELTEGADITFGNSSLKILWLPGHAPGHIGLLSVEFQFIVSGDVLFYRSIGRTDLPGGDHETLLASIRQKLYTLPDHITVHPGHGPSTTIGQEKIHNPFCPA